MNKSTFFSGQPVFSQLVQLIPRSIVSKAAEENNSDRYYKTFDTWHHLISMLFVCYGHCNSLREIEVGMRAFEGKLKSVGVKHFPARSTLSDANKKRCDKVFESIYYGLKKHYEHLFSSDSRQKNRVIIFDSTSISLFKEIFRGSGLAKANGKKKGGIKVHMAMEDQSELPSLVHFTDGASNDLVILPHLKTQEEDFLVFDRGYRDYQQYNKWTIEGKNFVTRLKDNTYILSYEKIRIKKEHKEMGVIDDQLVTIGHPNKSNRKLPARIITYRDPETSKEFKLLTNIFTMSPLAIAGLYKKRWQIELLFKRLKQNMPLNFFIGDNQTAIKIQIWSALIADLLLQVVKAYVKRRWAHSNIVSLIRLHLFNYISLYGFLSNPEKAHITNEKRSKQIKIEFDG